jgi:tetratricopeptide (TPR) repeat protein
MHTRSLTRESSPFPMKSEEEVSTDIKTEARSVEEQLHSNRAAIFVKQERWDRGVEASSIACFQYTISDCDQVLKTSPQNAKALFRRGRCHLGLGDAEKAAEDLKLAQSLAPDDAAIKESMNLLRDLEKKQDAKSAKAFSKMFT